MSPDAYTEMAKTESSHWWFRGRRAISSSILDTLHLKKGTKILEVGCGTGGNLQMLSNYGVVSAFEMDEVAHKIALQKTGGCYEIRVGHCPNQIPYKNEKFDLICMFDVLEHIQDDLLTLIKLKDLLKPEGKILITVPAYQFLYGPHDVFLHHKRRYTATHLVELIGAAGLESVRVSYFNTILFPLALIFRIKDKLLKSKSVSGKDIPIKSINEVLKYLFSLEKYPLKSFNLPFGVSLLCVLRAKNVI